MCIFEIMKQFIIDKTHDYGFNQIKFSKGILKQWLETIVTLYVFTIAPNKDYLEIKQIYNNARIFWVFT